MTPTERCNCGASCGENRYHDLGGAGCRFEEREKLLSHAGLSKKEKAILRHADEFHQSYAELATIFGIPVGTVKSRLSRARAKVMRAVP